MLCSRSVHGFTSSFAFQKFSFILISFPLHAYHEAYQAPYMTTFALILFQFTQMAGISRLFHLVTIVLNHFFKCKQSNQKKPRVCVACFSMSKCFVIALFIIDIGAGVKSHEYYYCTKDLENDQMYRVHNTGSNHDLISEVLDCM